MDQMLEHDGIALVPTVEPGFAEQDRLAYRGVDLRAGRAGGDTDGDLGAFDAAPLKERLGAEKQAADQKEIEERPQHQLGG
jgi:hypothetical protein